MICSNIYIYMVPSGVCRIYIKNLVNLMIAFASWTFAGDLKMEDRFMTPSGSLKVSLKKLTVIAKTDDVRTCMYS